MNSEDIDDLFRQQLDGHASPPSDDLWARLQLPGPAAEAAGATPEPLDTLFRAGLRGHATPPRRELWERLEDEHLRPQPRRRRVAAWWQYSAAAVLLLLLLAGGAGLWRGSFGPKGNDLATTQPTKVPALRPRLAPATPGRPALTEPSRPAATIGAPAGQQLAQAATEASKKNREIFAPQATAPRASTSSTPMATTTRPRRAAAASRAAGSHRQQPDAAAGQLATAGKRRPASQSLTPSQDFDNQVKVTHAPTTILAVATATTATPEVIEVDVRRGPAPAPVAAPVILAAIDATPPPTRRRVRLGGLLRQADHLVHGESVNLAEASDPSETVTFQARLGGRVLSKTIRL
ncbi:hypothetical protein [Hymenobacter bucti]|uniref:FecR protein domain-containing protein n=1 Tax=Hymenobacter bucti TaxID=1844114 RepID=A0ABW4R035_9BACT